MGLRSRLDDIGLAGEESQTGLVMVRHHHRGHRVCGSSRLATFVPLLGFCESRRIGCSSWLAYYW